MADHGAVETVFRHYRTLSPAFFGFAPFRSSVLVPNLKEIARLLPPPRKVDQLLDQYLNSIFWEIGFECQHLTLVDVRVVSFLESFLQLLQLILSENGAKKKIVCLASVSSYANFLYR